MAAMASRLPATLHGHASPKKAGKARGASALSRFLASLRKLPSPEARTDATLADFADSALQSMHKASMRYRPSTKALLKGYTVQHRQETLIWLVQAFDVMHFQDGLLFDATLLLDRYYACLPREDVRGGASQRKLLAAVTIALKMGSSMDTQVSLKHVVAHDLGRDQIPFEEIVDAELAILQKLRFGIGTPTARDFLETLDTRLKNDCASGACWNLADFLLQLTLADASLHYRYPHAILAAAALALALYATCAPPSAFVALVEDLALHCPDAAVPHASLVECCDALHMLWIHSVSGQDQSLYTRVLRGKFSRPGRNAAANIVPPHLPSPSFPPSQAWAAFGYSQEGFDNAAPMSPSDAGHSALLHSGLGGRGAAPAEQLGLAAPPNPVAVAWPASTLSRMQLRAGGG